MEILLILVFFGSITVYVVAREKINLRRAADGEDKERLKQAVSSALPEETGYQVAYGHYEKVEGFGRKTLTTYFYYALAFDTNRIWLMPLLFDKKSIVVQQPVLITSGSLGAADVNLVKNKDGSARRVDCTLYDKNGAAFLDCVVEVNNIRTDSCRHLNIIQKEECAQFGQLIGSIADQVNRENPGLKAQVQTAGKSMRRAGILGFAGTMFSVIFPPAGIVMSLAGIRLAKKGRVGTEFSASLLQCRAALALNIIFTVLAGAALIYGLLTGGSF